MNAQFEQATQAYKEGRFEDALQLFSQLSYENPKNAQIRTWLGTAYREVGLVEEAKIEFQEALKLADEPKTIYMARTALEKLTKHTNTAPAQEQSAAAVEVTHPVEVAQSVGAATSYINSPALADPVPPAVAQSMETHPDGKSSDVDLYPQASSKEVTVKEVTVFPQKTSAPQNSNPLMWPIAWWKNLKRQRQLFLPLNNDMFREDEFEILKQEFNTMSDNMVAKLNELEKLSLVVNLTSSAIILTNNEGLIEWVNEGFTRATGYTLEEVMAKKPGSLLQGPDTDPATVQRIREKLLSKQPFTEEILNYTKQGEPYWISLNITPSLDQDGNVLQFIAIESDITERKQEEEKQRIAKEQLQQQVTSLLSDIEGAAQGDLTVRANVTEGEMGTVADFFNAIIESLRAIVTQVKGTTGEVNTSLGANEESLRQLAEDAQKQSEEITRTLDSVQRMTLSLQKVASSARKAAEVTRITSARAELGEEAMDRTVRGILTLQGTVGETAKKVQRLGESSQKISKVASLINRIAIQTNLLAINAGVEAARAGEEGQGFAVVAKEVGALAARSASATKEIERIIDSIRLEISDVIEFMELSSAQAAEGSLLVEESKGSLGEILKVSRQIDQLSQMISAATVSQAETAESVNTLMQDIALASSRTSDASRQISGSLKQTVQAAKLLQESVETFKVEAGD
ncbi:MAG: methyl-accepting chemotaxis protein [Gloeobacterales cyanobacterium]